MNIFRRSHSESTYMLLYMFIQLICVIVGNSVFKYKSTDKKEIAEI